MNKKQKKLQEEFFNNYFFNLLNLISNIDIKKLIKISNFIEQCIKSKKFLLLETEVLLQ